MLDNSLVIDTSERNLEPLMVELEDKEDYSDLIRYRPLSELNKAGLKAIIAFDSYIKNKHARIDLDGNSQITGSNGKGKTSTLKLMQFFYGLRPDQAVDRTKGSFLNYYLPTSQSYVAYEYKASRENVDPSTNELKTVFLFTNTNRDGVYYRFYNGRYMDIYRSEEFKEIHKQTKSTYETLKKLSALFPDKFSNLINTTAEYSAIISNKREYLKRNKSTLKDANLFSLCKPENELKCLDTFVQVTTDTDGPFDSFKKAMINLFGLDHKIDRIPREDDIPQVLSTIKTLQFVKEKQKKIGEGIEKYQIAKLLYTDLLHYQSKAKAYEEEFLRSIYANEASKKESSEQITRVNSDFTSALAGCSERQVMHEANINQAKKSIEHIAKMEQIYKEKDVVGKKYEFLKLKSMEDQLNTSIKQLERLQNQSKDIYRDFERGKNQVQEESQQVLNDLTNRKSDAQQASAKQKDVYIQKSSFLKSKKEKELDALEENLKEPLKTLNEKLGLAQQELGQSKAYNDDENAQLKALEVAELELEQALINKRENLKSLRKYVLEKEDKRNKTLKSLDLINASIKRDQSILSDLRKLHFSDKTLLKGLRENLDPDFFVDAIKLIDKSLLSRTDLEISKGDDTSTFFGLNIKVNSLNTPDEANSIDEIKNRILSIEEDIESNNATAKQREKELATENTDVEAIKTEVAKCENEIQHLEKNRINALQAKQELKSKFSEQIDQRIAEAVNKVELVKGEIANLYQNHAKTKQIILDNFQQQEAELNKQLEEAKDQHKTLIFRLDNEKNSELAKLKQRIQELESLRDRRLKDEGVDVEITNKLELDIKSQQATISRVRGYGDLVDEHNRFMESEFLNKQEYAEKLHKYTLLKNSVDVEIKNLTLKKNEEIRTLNERIEKLNKEKDQLDRDLKYLQADISNIEMRVKDFDGVIPTPKPISSFNYLKEAVRSSLTDLENSIRDIKTIINSVEMIFQEDLLGEVWKAWSRRKESIKRHYNHPYFYILVMEQMHEFMDNEFSHLEDVTIMQFATIGEQLCGMLEIIHEHKAAVKRASNEIASSIRTQLVFKDITKLEFTVESTIDESTGIFPSLKKFKQAFQAGSLQTVQSKQSYSKDQFPDEHIIQALESSYKSLKNTDFRTHNRGDMIKLVINLIEHGNERTITNNNTLVKVSSEGMTRMIILSMFAALSAYINKDKDLTIHIPFDELGTIYPANTVRLINLMIDSNITIVTAQPSIESAIRDYFDYSWLIDTKSGLKEVVVDQSRKLASNPYLSLASKLA